MLSIIILNLFLTSTHTLARIVQMVKIIVMDFSGKREIIVSDYSVSLLTQAVLKKSDEVMENPYTQLFLRDIAKTLNPAINLKGNERA